MRKTRNAKLNLFTLENRLTPAVTSKMIVATNTLSITGDNQSNTILIAHHGSGALDTTDIYVVNDYIGNAAGQAPLLQIPGNFFKSYTGVQNIIIKDGNGYGATDPNIINGDAVVLTIDGGSSLSGALTVALGSGNDDFQVQTSDNTLATIGGNVVIRPGNGANNVFMFDTVVTGVVTVPGSYGGFRYQPGPPVKSFGNVFSCSDCTFNDDVVISNCATIIDHQYGGNTFNGNLTVRQTIPESAANPAGNYRNLDGIVYPNGALPGDPGYYTGLLVIDGGTTSGNVNVINGDLTFIGSRSIDGVYLGGKLNGNVLIRSDGSNDDIHFGDPRGPGPGGYDVKITGSATIVGGNQDEYLVFNDGTVVTGDVSISMGPGNATYDMNHSFSFGGLTLKGGNDTDNVGKLGGTIAGLVNVNLGSGANSIEFAYAGGTSDISYSGGSGVDNVILNGAYKSFTGKLGAGNDHFSYAAGASLSTFLFADGSSGAGDTFTFNGVVESWTATRKGFETLN